VSQEGWQLHHCTATGQLLFCPALLRLGASIVPEVDRADFCWCPAAVQGQIPMVLDDIQALAPTMFCAVPRVFDRIHAGIYEQVSSNGCHMQPKLYCAMGGGKAVVCASL
jgi:hypothetical protein